MNPELRQAMLAAIEHADQAIWAGVTSEINGRWSVVVLLPHGLHAERTAQFTLGDQSVLIRHVDIETTESIASRPIYLADFYEMPIEGARLIGHGHAAVDMFVARANPAILRNRIAPEMTGLVINWCARSAATRLPNGIGALHARALYAYVERHRQLPTQEQFNEFVRAVRTPWAVAITRDRRTTEDLGHDVLCYAQIAPETPRGPSFENLNWMDRWAGADVGPVYGNRYRLPVAEAPRERVDPPPQRAAVVRPPPPPGHGMARFGVAESAGHCAERVVLREPADKTFGLFPEVTF